MQIDFFKVFTAFAVSALFIWVALDPFNHAGLLHAINLAIHEIGHFVFAPLGQFLGVAGGSIFQILVPIFFCIYFIFRREFFSASLVLIWVGNNFFDVALYARDAVFMELPLLSFTGNEDTTIHDWNYLLKETGMLHRTNLIAGIIRAIGIVITMVGIAASFYFTRKESEI